MTDQATPRPVTPPTTIDNDPVAEMQAETARRYNTHDALVAENKELREALERYEAWEGKLLMDDKVWSSGLPKFTQSLYDEWMEIQALRNALLTKGGE